VKDDVVTPTFETPARAFSGRLAVVAMFALGITATAFLWNYWTVRMTPFMPLQKALEQRFPDSAPRAEGGTIKDSDTTVLQVVMRTKFDPLSDTPEAVAAVESRLNGTRELASRLADLASYEILALHLYFPLKEERISQQTFFRDVVTWEELDGDKVKGLARDPVRERVPSSQD
jgi:hypothetical protein